MSLVEELLAPISGENPVGRDLSDGAELDTIVRAYREQVERERRGHQYAIELADYEEAKRNLPPNQLPKEPGSPPPAPRFGEVVRLCRSFLNKCKHLRVAALLTSALLRQQGITGLSDGLKVLLGLMERYWDSLLPEVPGRASVLGWVGSKGHDTDLWYAVTFVPLTDQGQTYRDYRGWVPEDDSREEMVGDDETGSDIQGGEFQAAFDATDRGFYEALTASLADAIETLDALDSFCRERFAEAGVEAVDLPRYKDLKQALVDVSAAASDLLARKPPLPPGEEPAGSEDDLSGRETGPEGAVAGPTAQVSQPLTPEELVALAANKLRESDPTDPSSYLLQRGFRWGELRAGGEEPDPRALIPPKPEQRTQLKALFLDERWADVLDMGEVVMASEAGRAWLDLQRYEILAAERLGPDFDRVARALRGALRALIVDLPNLTSATLMDDSAAASRETLGWLESVGVTGEDRDDETEDGSDEDHDRIALRTILARAASMVRAGDSRGAVDLLMDRAEREGNERVRFLVRTEAAQVMVDHGMKTVALPILDELHQLIDEHKLEEWEADDTVARPMGLLVQCLDEADAPRKRELLSRLAKLDPLLAMRVRSDGANSRGSGSSDQTGSVGSGTDGDSEND